MMHEGASGGGKSELLQDVQRAADGRVLLGVNAQTQEEREQKIDELVDMLGKILK